MTLKLLVSRGVTSITLGAILILSPHFSTFASAAPDEYRELIDRGIGYVVPGTSPTVCKSATTDPAESGSTNTNQDYAGREILSSAQLKAIEENKSVYEEAAKKAGIPWQMLAVVHLRETGLRLYNPNDDGLFQIVRNSYPVGNVSNDQFLEMATDAANFLKNTASANYESNRNLSSDSGTNVIKDTFFSYNGRAAVYGRQAASVGFSASTEAYEGSPYVMNKADEKRDPQKNPNGWGQIKRDYGGIEYPANNDYGAFVTYGALAGVASSGTCSSDVSGPVRDKVVSLARQELAKWDGGELVAGNGYKKYSQGRAENWCADFVSWIYNRADYPLQEGNDGNVPAVTTVEQIGKENQKFEYHAAEGYTPQKGDIVVQTNGLSHVNIVVAVDGDKITVIGGNQGANGGGFNNSKVTQYTFTGSTGAGTTGYVSPKE